MMPQRAVVLGAHELPAGLVLTSQLGGHRRDGHKVCACVSSREARGLDSLPHMPFRVPLSVPVQHTLTGGTAPQTRPLPGVRSSLGLAPLGFLPALAPRFTFCFPFGHALTRV